MFGYDNGLNISGNRAQGSSVAVETVCSVFARVSIDAKECRHLVAGEHPDLQPGKPQLLYAGRHTLHGTLAVLSKWSRYVRAAE